MLIVVRTQCSESNNSPARTTGISASKLIEAARQMVSNAILYINSVCECVCVCVRACVLSFMSHLLGYGLSALRNICTYDTDKMFITLVSKSISGVSRCLSLTLVLYMYEHIHPRACRQIQNTRQVLLCSV